MQQGNGATLLSPLSQPSPLKNFVLGVNYHLVINWSCFSYFNSIMKLISLFTFNSQRVFPSVFYISVSVSLLFYWLLHIFSFLFLSSFVLLPFFLSNFFPPFFLLRIIAVFRVSLKVHPGLHNYRRLRYICTCDCKGNKRG